MKLALTHYLLCVYLVLGTAFAQRTELYMPVNIQKAYQNSTRNMDGTPGEKYFQNRADYQIQVQVDPETRIVQGQETVVYTNNSPKNLRSVVIRLYQNLYKRGSQRDRFISPEAEHDGVFIRKLIVGEDTLSPPYAGVHYSGTNMRIRLLEPLQSGTQLTLNIDWEFIIPKGTNIRMGTYGDHSYFLAYWYPQISVYDDIDGWDNINYGGLHEFYNDFGDFDVSISAPGDFTVWATGVLQNPKEVLAAPTLEKYRQAHLSDTVISLMSEKDYQQGYQPTVDRGINTWHFKAEYVPDFAFALADYYLWDATSAVIDEAGTRVYVDACYKPNSPDFPEVAEISKYVLEDLSHRIPGIPYPYPKMTIYNGEDIGGGMEYPMMVNDASSFSKVFSIYLTYHEIAHTYFPFYMGINERKYAWMDEGWASILPMDLVAKLVPGSNPLSIQMFRYIPFAGNEMERPLMTPSIQLKDQAYSVSAYSKPALAYYYLRDMLGDDVFKAALQEYIRRWNGKHPIPYDFFYSMNAGSGQNLNWFWQDWFFERGYPDLAFEEVQVKGKLAKLKIARPGKLPLPVHLVFTLEDDSKEEIHHTAAVWAKGETMVEFKHKFKQNIKLIEIGRSDIPDLNNEDNVYRVKEK